MRNRHTRVMRYLVLASILLLLAGCGSGVSQTGRPTAVQVISTTTIVAPTQAAEPVTEVPPTPTGVPPTTVATVPLTIPSTETTSTTSGEIAYLQHGDIWLLDLASGVARQLTQQGNIGSFTWTPDGNRIVFSRLPSRARNYRG